MLEAKNLNIERKGETLVSALSFVVDNGQMMCVSGNADAAGALLRSLVGLERVKSGFISIEGELLTPGSAPEFRKDMAYVPANARMPYPTMEETAHHFFALKANTGRKLTMRDMEEQMRALGMQEELLAMQQTQLTEQQEYGLMLALVGATQKKIMIVDTPPSGLDQSAAQNVARYLRTKANEGAAVIVAATSDSSDLSDLSDKSDRSDKPYSSYTSYQSYFSSLSDHQIKL